MKKLALILAIMLIPCGAFGMQMLDNNTMDSITGQSGVSIAIDDVQMFINIDKMAYIDCDGFDSIDGYGTCTGGPGAVAINDFQIDVLNINAIVATEFNNNNQSAKVAGISALGLRSVACGDIPLFFDYADTTQAACQLGSVASGATAGLNNYQKVSGYPGNTSDFTGRFLTIDVSDDLPAATDGLQAMGSLYANSTVGGVLIGLPTLEVYINDMVMTPVFDGDIGTQVSSALNDDDHAGKSYGTIELQGITFTVLSGWIEILPH